MASNTYDQLPTSLEEVVSLVLQLYRPGAQVSVVKTQETLHRLQRSPEGWRLANSLSNHENQEVRFFAALTFIVKLNTDAKSLGEEDVQALLTTLINWLIRCLEISEGQLVLRKLCSTLVVFFFQFSSSWQNCIKHLIYCVSVGSALPYESSQDAPDVQSMIQQLPDRKAVAIFWFASTLVEEVGKTDSNSMKQHKFHQLMLPNVDDIVPLISKYITDHNPTPDQANVRQEAMKCYQSWVSYSHRAFIDDGLILEPLRTFTNATIMCLADENLYEITMELLADVLSTYCKFFSEDDFQTLFALFNSQWAQERYQRLVQGDYDFDSIQFGLFTLAFGDATLQDLATRTEPQYQQFLTALGGLLGAEGYPVHEDKIFVPALEFWNAFVENMIDSIWSEDETSLLENTFAQMHVTQAIQKCWRKIQFPPSEIFNSWDSVDRTGFKDVRRDFSDLLQQFYLITKIPILDVFITLANKAVENRNWEELEASLFCLACFPDTIGDTEPRDEYLDKIFTAQIFSLFSTAPDEIPLRTMQSFLLLVDGYADYFEQNTAYLPNVLNIVFGTLASPALSYKASRTIQKLCSDCRKLLVPELDSFLKQYQSLNSNSSIDKHAKEAIMEGIASLVQAIPLDKLKLKPLDELLNFIEADIEECFRIIAFQATSEDTSGSAHMNSVTLTADSPALQLGLGALKSIIGIGRGLQTPHDTPIYLDEDEERSPFWTTGEGSRIQTRIASMVNRVYDVLGAHGDIVDAACHVWRQGFRELEPGAFVVAPAMIIQFLLKANFNTPRLGCVIGTACSFVTSHKSNNESGEIFATLVHWISQILQQQDQPSNDPEVAQNGIDFLTRLLSKQLSSLMSHQPPSSLEFLFFFTLKALAGTDPLPKSAAADFWSTFIGLPTQEDSAMQTAIDNVLQHLGPMLAEALIYNMGGQAARSELDKLSDPLKKLVTRQVRSKSWLEAALSGNSFPSDKVTTREKTVFLQKIMNLRGSRGTNHVVREFWLACRGTNFAYAS
ncbi:ARM repeat-containing protein [Glarea lozoyensis ATCC 20868]|uniref:ARM repeat-containing protein n=1 Tax=Glarea lozoyensis (strain ATCC 20868 / MF5171) TaxID=1116229 RepID=S3DPR8_GLAL2|nr:ARM repeat-containing protein [Glarea lozoyensis ATCC 20868]EPE34071.1 ARM repeat-containing protein [Glarea lozoyensis ATCC 20868]